MWQLHHKEWWAMKNWWFWTVVLHKTLESPLDCKEIRTVILKEINPEYSLEGPMLKLNFQYIGQLMWRTGTLEKTLLLGKIEGRKREVDRGWDGWMESPTRWAWVCPSSRSWWRTVSPGVLQSMELQGVGHYWANELNWTGNITNTICNWPVSPARLGLPKAPTRIPSQVCPHAQKSMPSVSKAFSEFWLQGDLHYRRHKGVNDTFIFLSQLTPK